MKALDAPMTSQLPRIEISYSCKKLLGTLFVVVILILVCALFLFMPLDPVPERSRQIPNGVVRFAALVFGLLLFLPARSLFYRITGSKTALILDAEGIRDYTVEHFQGVIKWADIDSVSQSDLDGIQSICLHVGEPTNCHEAVATKFKIAVTAVNLLGEGPVNIKGADKGADTFAELMRKDVVRIHLQDLSIDSDALFAQISNYHETYRALSSVETTAETPGNPKASGF